MESASTRFLFSTSNNEDIRKVLLYIQQDYAEKLDEVLLKAEEEFKHEKRKEILAGYAKVDEDYRLKEARTRSETLVYETKLKNMSRLRVLQNKYDHVEDLLEKARQRLSNKDSPAHVKSYKNILKALMIQGLCKLMEPWVVVYCRKMDVKLVRSLINECRLAYTLVSSLSMELNIGEGRYLPPDTEGGLLLASAQVTLDNTLASRLGTVGFYLLPYMANWLFGTRKSEGMEKFDYGFHSSYLPSLAELERPPWPTDFQHYSAIGDQHLTTIAQNATDLNNESNK